MKSKLSRKLKHRQHLPVQGGTTRMLKKNVPAESAVSERNGNGILRPETGSLKLPEDFIGTGEDRTHGYLPGRVMSTIVLLSVIFIAIIAWFVSQMPDK